jgi:hypothetical protein
MLAKFVAYVSLLLVSVVLGVLILVNGYGLEIQSWGWIIWGCLAQIVILALNLTIAKDD